VKAPDDPPPDHDPEGFKDVAAYVPAGPPPSASEEPEAVAASTIMVPLLFVPLIVDGAACAEDGALPGVPAVPVSWTRAWTACFAQLLAEGSGLW
jgi:hypothetical protein